MVVASTQLAHVAERHRRAGWLLSKDKKEDMLLSDGNQIKRAARKPPIMVN